MEKQAQALRELLGKNSNDGSLVVGLNEKERTVLRDVLDDYIEGILDSVYHNEEEDSEEYIEAKSCEEVLRGIMAKLKHD